MLGISSQPPASSKQQAAKPVERKNDSDSFRQIMRESRFLKRKKSRMAEQTGKEEHRRPKEQRSKRQKASLAVVVLVSSEASLTARASHTTPILLPIFLHLCFLVSRILYTLFLSRKVRFIPLSTTSQSQQQPTWSLQRFQFGSVYFEGGNTRR